jgi:hypothetical protein
VATRPASLTIPSVLVGGVLHAVCRFISRARCGTLTVVATVLDRDKLHATLDQAVIVIDADALERSRRDPRARAFYESAEELLVELESEGAEYS